MSSFGSSHGFLQCAPNTPRGTASIQELTKL
jgi:hypothetical protein